MKKVIIYVVGWAFIFLGIIGLVLPILQGVLFICVGLLVLSKEVPWADRLLIRLRKRFPKIGGILENARTIMDREFEKIETQKNYFWKRLPIFLAVLVALAALSWGLSLLFGWLKGVLIRTFN